MLDLWLVSVSAYLIGWECHDCEINLKSFHRRYKHWVEKDHTWNINNVQSRWYWQNFSYVFKMPVSDWSIEASRATSFWKPLLVPIKGSFKAGHQNPDLPIGALILWKQPGHLWSIITDWIANYIQGLDRDSGVRFVEERDELDIEYIVAYLKGGFSIWCVIDGAIHQSNSSINLKALHRSDPIWRCIRFGSMRRCWSIFEKTRLDFKLMFIRWCYPPIKLSVLA